MKKNHRHFDDNLEDFADRLFDKVERGAGWLWERLARFMDAGDYRLNNKHIFIWLGVTLIIYAAF